MPEKDPRNDGNQDTEHDSDTKANRTVLHTVHQVHAEKRGNQRGQHQDDGDRGERTHDGVHVVVDDALVGVHRRL